ncbi:MAG TPA: hypothetical protein VM686_05405 [Polyangiaceae bacterium]|jgi:hypothetical protein|nr:hypothetical protein [Polyangiaceae bacterium]
MSIRTIAVLLGSTALAAAALSACAEEETTTGEDLSKGSKKTDPAKVAANRMIDEGRSTFRFDTFGDEAFWGGQLKLHLAIAGEENDGVGPGISPLTALSLGLKVDVEALPRDVVAALKNDKVDLESPATTLLLLQANAVVGLTGFFDESGQIESLGIQCALCHSVVDDSLMTGIGKRLDGWPNRDLNVGAIISAAPDLSVVTNLLGVSESTLKAVLAAWGPGKFDAEVFLDGKGFRPDGKTAATLIPAAFGLAGVNLHTYTGWGSVTYWNAFVANLEMHGQGTFYDPRLQDEEKFPIAAANGFDDVRNSPDLITPKLAALHFYQLALEAPPAPADRFDAAAAERGKHVFNGAARCAQCHVPPLFTEPGWNMHTPEEIGIDDFQSNRSPDEHYRTTPLKGLWTREKGGFYHDGRFATLADVVEHYDDVFDLPLDAAETSDLIEYLKSL